jgi:nicotinamidase-related amidase
MPAKNSDLHGNAPDEAPTVLLLIDVINDLEFDGGDALLAQALPMAERLAALKRRARAARIPAVYVNDNFGRWRSDFAAVVRHSGRPGSAGRPIVRLLRPSADDYFVLKPKHSGFFQTSLSLLLIHLGVRHLILTGMTGPLCVFFTASDAHMRDYRLVVPSDCVASPDPEDTRWTLANVRRLFNADISASADLDLDRLNRPGRERPARRAGGEAR